MPGQGLHYFPLSLPFLLALAGLLLLATLVARVLRYAYERVGVPRRYVFGVLFASLLGSYINIPIARFPSERVLVGQDVVLFGVHHIVPAIGTWPGTVVCVNLGGAVIPTLLAVYLLVKQRLYRAALPGTAAVAAVCHSVAHLVPGMGIAEPVFVPPLTTAIVALLLSRRDAAPLAYICGTLGTLIGADLLNLGKIRALATPISSIGGAGTFDGIFLTGLIAVLLASLTARPQT